MPLPIAIAILTIPDGEARLRLPIPACGVVMTMIGELIRLWGVRQIGAVSRTRSDRLGPLVETGPFALMRNPLYLGNIAVWVGFALTARLLWLAPIVFLLLAAEYHAIVKWEERLLEARLGDAYRAYAARVPRWIPRPSTGSGRATPTARKPLMVSSSSHESSASSASSAVAFRWTETLFSERGTLLAIAAGYLLLWLKARF